MPRREFSKAVKAEIVRRATRDGFTFCEGCGGETRRFDIDHTIPDAMMTDKSKPLTAAEGKLLCSACHTEKTSIDQGDIARAKRQEAAHLGIAKAIAPAKPIRSAPMPTTAKAAARVAKGHRPPVTRTHDIYGREL